MNDDVDRSELTPEELAEARLYPLLIEWSPEDSAFVVSVPDLPGVHTHGLTREEAAAMGDEVVAVSLSAMRRRERPIPAPSLYAGRATEERPSSYTPERIRGIRRRFDVSQRVFAEMLNVSLSTVRSWEQGLCSPDGAATRLLGIAERHPDAVVAVASSDARAHDRVA